MANAVLTTKRAPGYDDLPEEQYHFPQTYRRQMEAAVGDWIVYYEPRRTSTAPSSRGGRQAYFATARVDRIVDDPRRPDHFYALVSGFLDFDRPVPFAEGGRYYENGLRRPDGETSKGAFGRSVRLIPMSEYEAIVAAGFSRTLHDAVPALPGIVGANLGFAEEQAAFERLIVERVISRPFRDAAFALSIRSAYGETCAMTGLRIINGGGRAEVQAAHIRPVASGGSDSVRNGLALSRTIHWMFDRGLLSIGDDYSILVAKGHVPEGALRLIREDRRLIRPSHDDLLPHPAYLRFHRQQIFKG